MEAKRHRNLGGMKLLTLLRLLNNGIGIIWKVNGDFRPMELTVQLIEKRHRRITTLYLRLAAARPSNKSACDTNYVDHFLLAEIQNTVADDHLTMNRLRTCLRERPL